MSWKDLTNRAKDWVREKGAEIFASKDKPYSDLGNGGSSGYYPGVAARQERTQRMQAMKEETARQATMQMTQSIPVMENQTQSVPMQQGYTQQFQNPPMQQGYTQQFQNAPASTSYTQQFQSAPASTGYTQQFQTPPAAAYTQQFQNYAQAPQWQQPPVQQPQPAPQQAPDNISFMPGNYVDGSRAYVHVERITQLVSFQACYRIIEFMKNGESVIVNTESIPNEAEVIRCIDMLSGAAYTLGCSITKITNIKRAYLISPPTVQVLADVFIKRMSDRRNEDGMRRRTGRYADEPSRSYGEDTYTAPQTQGYAPQQSYEPQQMAAGYGSYAGGQDFGQTSAYQGGSSTFGTYGSFAAGGSYGQ